MRDRDESGRPHNARPRDALGRPLPYGAEGVQPLPADVDTSMPAAVDLTQRLLDEGMPFGAHEVLEAVWKQAPPDERAAWQGLAQLAVALTHAQRGNSVGAARVRQRAVENLAAARLPDAAAEVQQRLLDATASLAVTPHSSGDRSP